MGSLGTAVALAGLDCAGEPTTPPVIPDKPPAPILRTLGRTGMTITVVSMGCMRTSEQAVFEVAADMGINYFDTARVYMNGKNERVLGEALKNRRDKVFIATKVKPGSKEAMRQSIEESLAALKVDHVDLLQMHDISSKEDVLKKEYRDALAEAKQQGKTRFAGLSVHKNMAVVINAMVDDPEKFYDTVLATYNFHCGADVKAAIERAAKANIGVIAMKTQGGGYKAKDLGEIGPHQAALKWVLRDTNVTAAIPSMVDLAQLKEDTAVMGIQLTQADLDLLERYKVAIAPYYCHRCGGCTGTCPKDVDIPAVNRCLMYAEGYGDLELARATYEQIPPSASLGACRDCGHCSARCVRSLNLDERLDTARTLFDSA
jgi:hypothetical protein